MTTTTKPVALNPIEELLLGRIESAARISPLVSIAELRASAGVARRKFDNAILALARFGRLDLYRSDLPARLMSSYERDGVLWCGAQAFNGCSIRQA